MDNTTSGTATPSYTPASAMNDTARFPYLYYPLYPDEFPVTGPGGDLSTYVYAGNDYLYDANGDGGGTPVLGSVTSSLQIALSANLKYVYYDADGNPAAPPAGSSPTSADHLDLLVRTGLDASADADNDRSGVSGGMSAHADASDGLGGSVSADGTPDNSSLSQPQDQSRTFYRLRRVSLSGGSAQLTASGTLDAAADNELSPKTPVNLSYPGTIPGDLVGGTLAEASASLNGAFKVDSREVTISSGIETSYFKGGYDATLGTDRHPNPRSADGGMAVDSVLQWQSATDKTGASTGLPQGWVVNDFPFTANALNFTSPTYAWTASGQGSLSYSSPYSSVSRQTVNFSVLEPGDGASAVFDSFTVNVTDSDGAVASNNYTVCWHLPAENWTPVTPGAPYVNLAASQTEPGTAVVDTSASGQ